MSTTGGYVSTGKRSSLKIQLLEGCSRDGVSGSVYDRRGKLGDNIRERRRTIRKEPTEVNQLLEKALEWLQLDIFP